jgi:myo-inositol-1(or 4)-monophosphatase
MIDSAVLSRLTAAAADFAKQGAALAIRTMGTTTTRLKSDNTVVTESDQAVQEMITREIRRNFPDHGVLGEEESDLLTNEEICREFVWVIDPIDGTRNYAASIPVFTCSVAVMHNAQPVVGAIAYPQPTMVYAASIDSQTTLNGVQVSVNDIAFSQQCLFGVSGSKLKTIPPFLREWAGKYIVRDFGSVAYHLALVASGQMDIGVNLKGKLWDIAAGALLVERAGGKVFRLSEAYRPMDVPLWPIDIVNDARHALPLAACSPKAYAGLWGSMSAEA